MNQTISKLGHNSYFSCVKNLGDWYFGEMPDEYNYGNSKLELLHMAVCAWYISDYQWAVQTFKNLLRDYTDCDPDEVKKMQAFIDEYNNSLAGANRNVVCDDERLAPIMERLSYVYDKITKDVIVFVAKSEDDYNEFFKETFPGKELYPYDSFFATGLHHNPKARYLVFKEELVNSMDDTELLGLCAHEMAHLDLLDSGIDRLFNRFEQLPSVDNRNMFMSEHLTDLYAISKGFAYPLYKSRARFGNHFSVMSAEEIKLLILNPEQI